MRTPHPPHALVEPRMTREHLRALNRRVCFRTAAKKSTQAAAPGTDTRIQVWMKRPGDDYFPERVKLGLRFVTGIASEARAQSQGATKWSAGIIQQLPGPVDTYQPKAGNEPAYTVTAAGSYNTARGFLGFNIDNAPFALFGAASNAWAPAVAPVFASPDGLEGNVGQSDCDWYDVLNDISAPWLLIEAAVAFPNTGLTTPLEGTHYVAGAVAEWTRRS